MHVASRGNDARPIADTSAPRRVERTTVIGSARTGLGGIAHDS